MDFFKGKKVVIATKHRKEVVIAPILEKELGLICVSPKGLDTDRLGTFTGEVERLDDPITTLRKKCLMAIEHTGIGIAVANEGSFGPHPSIVFAQADDELIMLLDKENSIEIVERELSLETNFDGAEVGTAEELVAFANRVGFPKHGIILKKAKNNFLGIVKESRNMEELVSNYNAIKLPDGTAYAETDMRAMNNPTRMDVIARAAQKLASRLKVQCPECGLPGFGVVDAEKGLPCEACGLPTRSTKKHIYRCQGCDFVMSKDFPFGKMAEDPQYCDFCNP